MGRWVGGQACRRKISTRKISRQVRDWVDSELRDSYYYVFISGRADGWVSRLDQVKHLVPMESKI